ncbi:hypothetical protein [Mycobacterium sp.]|uniref:hypothetical protein n=1 Tax=Mycobacterium sp. TaxID=1785 RepID=UPI002D96E34A|nr:hypothetical protein [Mycobacterium sp.]
MAVPVDAPALLTDWIERVVVPPSLGAPVPTPQFPPIVAPTSIGTSIKGVYNTVEPWVQYGFDLAAYAVGWVPYVGWLAPQITIFYHFGERITRSITFNIADFLDGQISFTQGLINVGVDTFNSFVQLGIDQWNFWLPPLPPLPPFPLSTQLEPAANEPLTTAVESLAVAAPSGGNTGPKPKKNDEAARGRTTTNEPPSGDPREPVNANKAERAERVDSATRTSTTDAGAEGKPAKADRPKADGAKADGPKSDGPKDKKRNDE